MTDKIDLLPMPKGEASGMYQAWSYDQMEDYARANVAHATAALQAEIDALRTRLEDTVRDSTNEIEALRAEVESVTCELVDAITRADKLAGALRLAEEHINDTTPEWYSAGQRVLAEIRTTLKQEEEK